MEKGRQGIKTKGVFVVDCLSMLIIHWGIFSIGKHKTSVFFDSELFRQLDSK